ncbi:hypothetical protein ABVK25_000839 [Lepraria finkii]|uniref:Uncharacterized protein n=1 Tax=Lepraria finkii TaxID=1340010 RepID=A0ABR4BP10_9LECA
MKISLAQPSPDESTIYASIIEIESVLLQDFGQGDRTRQLLRFFMGAKIERCSSGGNTKLAFACRQAQTDGSCCSPRQRVCALHKRDRHKNLTVTSPERLNLCPISQRLSICKSQQRQFFVPLFET